MAIKAKKLVKNSGIDGNRKVQSAAGETERQEQIAIDRIAYHENNDYRNYECDDASIQLLADAIQEQGFLGSLIVCERSGGLNDDLSPAADKDYVLLAGERRLRAVKKLVESDVDAKIKFSRLPCTVKSGFSEDATIRRAQEMVILDGNNINTRGGLSGLPDDGFAIKVTNRYIENLMVGYQKTKKEASKQIKEISGQARTVSRNVHIYEKLNPDLFELIIGAASGVTKMEADSIAAIPQEEQLLLVEAYRFAGENRTALGEEFGKIISQLTKNLLEASLLPQKEERLQNYARLTERLKAQVAEVLQEKQTQAARQEQELAKAQETIDELRAAAASQPTVDAEAIHRQKTAEAVKLSRDSKKKRLLEKDRKTYYGYIKRAMNSLDSLKEIEGVGETLGQLEENRGNNESIVEALNRIVEQVNELLAAMKPESDR